MSLNAEKINQFIESQLEVWPTAKANFEALKSCRTKELVVDGMSIKVQFNPARIVSSGAKVDAKSVAARRCFLCEANRPAEQSGIEWQDRYTVLINPFPIFPRHLTIPDKTHCDQLIAGRIADMIKLAAQLEGYTVFYNGPFCGASAPDHMHFQAGNSDFLTFFDTLAQADMKSVATEGASSLSMIDSLPLNVFVIDAANAEEGQTLFDRLYAAMPIAEGHKEPMMNILCAAQPDGTVRVVVIPRKRHRPTFYGTDEPGTMLISPASIDMGGVFITPLEKDFDAFDADTAREIYRQLCLDNTEINKIAQNVI